MNWNKGTVIGVALAGWPILLALAALVYHLLDSNGLLKGVACVLFLVVMSVSMFVGLDKMVDSQ